MTPTLFHYTCQHSMLGISSTLILRPFGAPRCPQVVWMTDLPEPDRDALGLTSTILACDRTEYRYRVTDTSDVRAWHAVRRSFPIGWRLVLESAPGANPDHWWLSFRPVPVIPDPIRATA